VFEKRARSSFTNTIPCERNGQIARETGLGRDSFYKALSPDGNPEFSTVLKVVRALGLRLRATAADA